MNFFVKMLVCSSLFLCLSVQYSNAMETDTKHGDDSEPSEFIARKNRRGGFRRLFGKRVHAQPEVTAEVTQQPRQEYVCESARYLPHPDTKALFESALHRLSQRRLSQSDQECIAVCKKAFNYNPSEDDPTISQEDEKRRLCERQHMLRLILGAIHKDEKSIAFEVNQKLREAEHNCQQKMNSLAERLNAERAKNTEKDVLVQQIILQHKENTRLAYMSLGLSSVVAIAGIISTGYALSKGRA